MSTIKIKSNEAGMGTPTVDRYNFPTQSEWDQFRQEHPELLTYQPDGITLAKDYEGDAELVWQYFNVFNQIWMYNGEDKENLEEHGFVTRPIYLISKSPKSACDAKEFISDKEFSDLEDDKKSLYREETLEIKARGEGKWNYYHRLKPEWLSSDNTYMLNGWIYDVRRVRYLKSVNPYDPILTPVVTPSQKPVEANDSSRNWTEDFKHENGNYTNTCIHCNKNFIGYKRRVICKLCSQKPVVKEAKIHKSAEEVLAEYGYSHRDEDTFEDLHQTTDVLSAMQEYAEIYHTSQFTEPAIEGVEKLAEERYPLHNDPFSDPEQHVKRHAFIAGYTAKTSNMVDVDEVQVAPLNNSIGEMVEVEKALEDYRQILSENQHADFSLYNNAKKKLYGKDKA